MHEPPVADVDADVVAAVEDEVAGVDGYAHAESGYDFGGTGGTRRGVIGGSATSEQVKEGATA